MRKSLCLLALLAALVASGCGKPKTVEDRKSDITKQLPLGAKVLEDRGNYWWLIEIKGKKYLYHSYCVGSNMGVETIVEVKE